ncbi:MAG TPA: lytic transglycosylase domain-containing protein [Solirubrobacteraceae bacterium]|nr:lytic transglycosylase domain-containing protein [Solirubrobacteraceae bacterium]
MSATSRAPAISTRRRVPSRRQAAIRRRRRALLALGALVVVVIGAVLAAPLAQRAINDLTLPLQYSGIIRQQAAAKRLPPDLVAAVIFAETKFDARTSPTGAEGLMQIEPQTALFLARRSGATNFHTSDLGTPSVNIAYGTYYLRYLLNEYGGSLVAALAAYNGGETNVDHWIAQDGGGASALRVNEIPFPETRAYVQRVLQAQQDYRQTYPRQLGYG